MRRVLPRSGFSQFDDHLAEEINALNTFFVFLNSRYAPEVFIYDDRAAPFGGIALRVDGAHARILIGLSLLIAEQKRVGESWPSSVIGAMAHEWAHAYQYRAGLDDKLELHADYMSGWYMGHKQRYGLAMDINVFSDAIYLRGGKSGQFRGRPYGSPEQRVAAMLAGRSDGYSRASLNTQFTSSYVNAASNRGYSYVSTL
ncbi:hypothetical protein [Methylobacterium tardum]|uniref:hypothetical protein n=1 Tax=Methylobacterium tardum TaxID=374432 RepID=UPI001EDF6BCF|nr:hypothetical protein [Methylobacterium tardum]